MTSKPRFEITVTEVHDEPAKPQSKWFPNFLLAAVVVVLILRVGFPAQFFKVANALLPTPGETR